MNLRRVGVSLLAVVPMALVVVASGQVGSAAASPASRHVVVPRTARVTPSSHVGFTPPLPAGTRYAPASARQPSGASAGLAALSFRGAPPADRRTAPRPSAAALRVRSSTKRSLKAAPVPPTTTEITAVSCSSSTLCVAVGWTSDYDTDVGYAAKWNGHAWSTMSVPHYAPNGYLYSQELYGVSCPSATSCVAVGYASSSDEALSETWNGSKWSLQLTSVSEYPELFGVSCVSSHYCKAVGTLDDEQPLALTWDGSTWTTDSMPPIPDSENYLYGVSCTSDTSCTAAGVQDRNETLVMSWAGASWAQVTALNPGDDYDHLYGISCAAGVCMAVGTQENGDQVTGLIEKLNVGSTSVSSATSGANPDISFTDLAAVSCSSASFCVAVGYGSSVGEDIENSYAASYNGSKWKAITSASPGMEPYDAFMGVSCVSSSRCIAVGTQWSVSTSFTYLALAEGLSKGAFVTSSVPNLFTTEGYVDAVACASSRFCVAVGTLYPGDADVALVELWNGQTWRMVASPSPGGYASWLDGASCTSTTFCMLVGGFESLEDDNVPLVVTYNGSSLVAHVAPISDLDEYEAALYSVSCVSPSACLAVGEQYDPPFSVWWNGRSLSVSAMLQPQDEYADPYAVSCVSKSKCFAVVEYETSQDYQSYISEWDGSRWSFVTEQVRIPGESEVELEGMHCYSSKRCIAVGAAYSGSYWRAVSDIYNGSKWSVSLLALPLGSESFVLEGITCTTASSCIAVGESESLSNGDDYPAMSKLTGSTWSHSTVVGKGSGQLYSIACASSSLCFAGGVSYPSLSNDKALIEQDKNGSWSVAP